MSPTRAGSRVGHPGSSSRTSPVPNILSDAGIGKAINTPSIVTCTSSTNVERRRQCCNMPSRDFRFFTCLQSRRDFCRTLSFMTTSCKILSSGSTAVRGFFSHEICRFPAGATQWPHAWRMQAVPLVLLRTSTAKKQQ